MKCIKSIFEELDWKTKLLVQDMFYVTGLTNIQTLQQSIQ